MVRFLIEDRGRDFPGGLVVKTPCAQCRGLGSIPGQGTRSHMQPKSCRLQQRQKNTHATTKIWHEQIIIFFKTAADSKFGYIIKDRKTDKFLFDRLAKAGTVLRQSYKLTSGNKYLQ